MLLVLTSRSCPVRTRSSSKPPAIRAASTATSSSAACVSPARRPPSPLTRTRARPASTGARPRAAPRARRASPRRSASPRTAPRAAGRRSRTPPAPAAGWPVSFQTPFRRPSPTTECIVRSAAEALGGADPRRERRRHGRQQHVVVGQRLVQPRGVRLPAPERPVERALRQHAPEARQRADPPFQALGMGERRGLLVDAAQVDRGELRRGRQRAVIDLPLVHLVAEAPQQLRRLLQRRAVLLMQLRRAATAAACSRPRSSTGRARSTAPRRKELGGTPVAPVSAGPSAIDIVEQGRIGDRARQHAVDDSAVPGASSGANEHAPALGLQPEQPALGRRNTDRSAPVAAERGAHQARGHRRGAAAAGAARAAPAAPTGCASRPTSRSPCTARSPQLGDIRLADHDRARLAHPPHDLGVRLRGPSVGARAEQCSARRRPSIRP